MKKFAILLGVALFTLFSASHDFAFGERLKRSKMGLGGKDVRIPLEWIKGSAPKGARFSHGPGDYGRELRFGRVTRFYEIHVPQAYSKTKPLAVVLNFHGGGGYPAGARYQTGMDRVSDREGFIVVYPAGAGKLFKDRLLVWNDGRPDQRGKPSKVDDVGFVSALLDDLGALFNIDPKRVYACGISNGAQFSYRLAKQLPNRIAAIAAVAGQRPPHALFPPPPRPISVMQFSGLKDNLHPYQGGIPPAKAGRVKLAFETTMEPVKESIQSWATFNGCHPEPVEVKRVGKALLNRYGSCKDDVEVVLWTLEDGGHTWPGGKRFPAEIESGVGEVNRDISASELMWEFFKRHHLK